FCLHKGILLVHSPALENILTMPSGVEHDGTDESHPILIKGITCDKFAFFMSWIYHVSLLFSQVHTHYYWVAPAIHSLILSPLSTISENDTHQLGLCVYSIIAKAHEIIEVERKTLAAVPPGLSLDPSANCSNSEHPQCKDAWIKFWWKKVAHQLLHPT
ncbi:hypothetical protein SCLCIDRAFT_126674, partial [Scleroderma citrinum Foug A]